ncbi:MAG: flagellar hook-length control protein FliK [Rhodoferax sp.]
MSGLTPLVDTLLATRLAQRLDLVPLKAQVDLADPGFANQVELVSNDVRLNSREGLQQQLGVGSGGQSAGLNSARAGQGESVTLSSVARALTAILDPPSKQTPGIFGTTALWPDSQTPDTPKLAATLERTVAGSGLFYESHLQQFASGTRTLEQIAQEPQARLNQAAHRPGQTAMASDKEAAGLSATRSSMAPAAEPSGPAIHPGAATLVRQQLELLAQPQFRWCGEAWPGVPMDWQIEQDEDQKANQGEADGAALPRSWTTRVAMSLPRLGDVEARLSISGSTLQLRLAASERATVSLLNVAGTELPQRLDAQGLQLTGLQVVAMAAQPAVNP